MTSKTRKKIMEHIYMQEEALVAGRWRRAASGTGPRSCLPFAFALCEAQRHVEFRRRRPRNASTRVGVARPSGGYSVITEPGEPRRGGALNSLLPSRKS